MGRYLCSIQPQKSPASNRAEYSLPANSSPPWYVEIEEINEFQTYHNLRRSVDEAIRIYGELQINLYEDLQVNIAALSDPPWYADVERELGFDPYYAFVKEEVTPDSYYTFGPYYAEIERYFGLGEYYAPLPGDFLGPYYANARIGLGTALNGQGRFEEAEVAFQMALDLAPEDAAAYFGLWQSLRGQGRFEEAEVVYREVLNLIAYDAATYINLGTALYEQRRFEEAEAAHWEAIRLGPSNYAAYSGLGIALYEQNRFEEAASAFQESLRLMPHNLTAEDGLEKVAQQAGKAPRGTLRFGLNYTEFLGIENIEMANNLSSSDNNESSVNELNNPSGLNANQLVQAAFELYQKGDYSEAEIVLFDILAIQEEELGKQGHFILM